MLNEYILEDEIRKWEVSVSSACSCTWKAETGEVFGRFGDKKILLLGKDGKALN